MDTNANGAVGGSTSGVRLSWTQKLDLLGMSAAAVITTALIAAPMIGPYVGSDEELDAEPQSSLVMAVAAPDARPIAAVAASTFVEPRSTEKRRIAARPLSAITQIATASPSQVVAASAAANRTSKPLGRKLAGLFIGDGTHAVRPFPTVPSERQ